MTAKDDLPFSKANQFKQLRLAGDKPRRKTIENRLDKLWSKVVRSIWAKKIGIGKCAVLGCQMLGNNPHHIIRKSKGKGLRWAPENGIVLCAGHHTLNTPSAHNPPLDDLKWFERVLLCYYTPSDLQRLAVKGYSTCKFSINDLLLLERDLEWVKGEKGEMKETIIT